MTQSGQRPLAVTATVVQGRALSQAINTDTVCCVAQGFVLGKSPSCFRVGRKDPLRSESHKWAEREMAAWEGKRCQGVEGTGWVWLDASWCPVFFASVAEEETRGGLEGRQWRKQCKAGRLVAWKETSPCPDTGKGISCKGRSSSQSRSSSRAESWLTASLVPWGGAEAPLVPGPSSEAQVPSALVVTGMSPRCHRNPSLTTNKLPSLQNKNAQNCLWGHLWQNHLLSYRGC